MNLAIVSRKGTHQFLKSKPRLLSTQLDFLQFQFSYVFSQDGDLTTICFYFSLSRRGAEFLSVAFDVLVFADALNLLVLGRVIGGVVGVSGFHRDPGKLSGLGRLFSIT